MPTNSTNQPVDPFEFEEPFSDGLNRIYAINDVTMVRVTTCHAVSGLPEDEKLSKEVDSLFDWVLSKDKTEVDPHTAQEHIRHPALGTFPEPIKGPCKSLSGTPYSGRVQYIRFKSDNPEIVTSEALLFDMGRV